MTFISFQVTERQQFPVNGKKKHNYQEIEGLVTKNDKRVPRKIYLAFGNKHYPHI